METQQSDNLDRELNNAGRRVFQMRNEGRDLEYMVNQLSYEGYSNEVIRRIMYADQAENKKQKKIRYSGEATYYFWIAGIHLFGVILIAVLSFLIGWNIKWVAIDFFGMLSGIVFLIIGLVKRYS